MKEKLIREISSKYGTPFYIYSFDIIKKKVSILKDILTNNSKLYYSVKTNPNIDVLKYIKAEEVGSEVSSYGELLAVIYAGFDPNSIIISGPYKSRKLLSFAIEKNCRCIIADSIKDITNISLMCKQLKKEVRVAIRINPDNNNAGAGMKMTGKSSQFGIRIEDIKKIIGIIKENDLLRFIGIQVYYGTQILESNKLTDNFERIIDIVKNIEDEHDIKLSFIDFGGGFGIPYFTNQKKLNIKQLKADYSILMKKHQTFLQGRYCVFESGRFLLAESGVYVTSIVSKKTYKNDTFLICDGGSNHHASSAFLGRLIMGNYPTKILHSSIDSFSTSNHSSKEIVIITGPTCSPSDIIARNVNLYDPKEGDLIVVEKAGAYGLNNSPVLFSLHGLPNEFYTFGKSYYKSNSMNKLVSILLNEEINEP